jgi:excisionase family DNA binding protein
MDNKQNISDSYWCKKDIAKYFAVSTRKIEHMMKKGLLPYIKFGGSVRFDPEKVKAFVEANFSGNVKMAKDSRRLE